MHKKTGHFGQFSRRRNAARKRCFRQYQGGSQSNLGGGNMLSFKRGLLLAAGILLFSTLSFSQTSTISGTVYDPSGAVIGGVDVTAKNEATGVDYKQISNEVGLFSFPAIPVGSYTLTVELSGFKASK